MPRLEAPRNQVNEGRRHFLRSAWPLAVAAALPAVPLQAARPVTVRYPAPESAADERSSFPIAVLRMALEASNTPARLVPLRDRMQQARSLIELERGNVDVVWTMATRDRARGFRMVRPAIDDGLIGWRMLMVRRHDLSRISRVRTLAALRTLVLAQGHDWPDLAILRANGLNVEPSSTYEGLFTMLQRDHVDALPRSVLEIDAEAARFAASGLAVADGLLVHYPARLHFFVRPGHERLASALETGLAACKADGRLDALLDHVSPRARARVRAAGATVLTLRNPLTDEAT